MPTLSNTRLSYWDPRNLPPAPWDPTRQRQQQQIPTQAPAGWGGAQQAPQSNPPGLNNIRVPSWGRGGIPQMPPIDVRTQTPAQAPDRSRMQRYQTDAGLFWYDPYTGQGYRESGGAVGQGGMLIPTPWAPPGAGQTSQITLGGYGSMLMGTGGTAAGGTAATGGSMVAAPQTTVPVSPVAGNIIGSAQQALESANAANEQRYQQLQQVNQQMGQQQLDALRAGYEQQMQMLAQQQAAQAQAQQAAQQQLMQQLQAQQQNFAAALAQAQQQQSALAQQPAQTGQQIAAQYGNLLNQIGAQQQAQQQTVEQAYQGAGGMLRDWSQQAANRIQQLESDLAAAIQAGDTATANQIQQSIDRMRNTVQQGSSAIQGSIAGTAAERQQAASRAAALQQEYLRGQYAPLAEEARNQYGQLLSTVGGDEARQMAFLEEQRRRQGELISGMSQAEYEREAQLRQRELGNLQQQLVSRGLGNTTVRVPLEQSIVDLSRLREREIADRRLQQQLGVEQAYTGYGAGVLGTTAGRRLEAAQAAIERPLGIRQEAARAGYQAAGEYGSRLYETAAQTGAERTAELGRARELGLGVEQTGLSAQQQRIGTTTAQRLAAAQTGAQTALGQMGQIAQTGIGLATQRGATQLNIQQQAAQQANQATNQAIAALAAGYNASQIQQMDTAQRLSTLGLSYLQNADAQTLQLLKTQLDQQLAGLTDQQRLQLAASRDYQSQQLAILDALRTDLERIIESRSDVPAVTPAQYGALLATGAV